MSRLLCKEKLKQKELAREHATEKDKLKKELANCKERLKVYEANSEAQEIEVVYNEEVISTDDNTTYENQVDYNVDNEVSISQKIVFTLVVTVLVCVNLFLQKFTKFQMNLTNFLLLY